MSNPAVMRAKISDLNISLDMRYAMTIARALNMLAIKYATFQSCIPVRAMIDPVMMWKSGGTVLSMSSFPSAMYGG